MTGEAAGEASPTWLARFTIDATRSTIDEPLVAIEAVSGVLRQHGVAMCDGVSGFLTSAANVNAAALATSPAVRAA